LSFHHRGNTSYHAHDLKPSVFHHSLTTSERSVYQLFFKPSTGLSNLIYPVIHVSFDSPF
ncbi:hypothetical protein NHG52_13270, partial [Bacillus thuringiensis]|uniref:hypothetical protein n=1 Tax=Bacillus thuringiensis TaxID=1428 RepID=UPI0021586272